MSRILIQICLLSFLIVLLERCANPTAITGGAKDTIPPSLIATNPIPQSINVSTQEFSFEFDESINADKLSQELLITPTTDIKFTHTIKKNTVTIKFAEQLSDSTTYTFNFREGIADATERNPVLNFKYAFSTGTYIDSLTIGGSIISLLKKEPQRDYLVGLYVITDTLSPTHVKPYYFYNTDTDGRYQIENIRAGEYLLFSFQDKNNNLLFNPKDEPFAVYSDTIQINSTTQLDSVNIPSVQINADKLTTISARPSGNLFSIRYSKPINIISIQIDDYQDKIAAIPQLTTDKTEIEFYKNPEIKFDEADSIKIITYVSDTLNATSIDTVYLRFPETNRKPKDISISASNLIFNQDTLVFNINSSKPIIAINENFITIQIDTLINYSPSTSLLKESSPFRGNYRLELPFPTDSLYELANRNIPDSLHLSIPARLSVELGTTSLLGIEKDTLSKPLTLTLQENKKDDTGTINISINTEEPSFELRLINKSNRVIRTSKNLKIITFSNLKPDSYSIEIYIDTNKNGRWDVANPWKNLQSEPVYVYPNKTELKSNWIVDIEDINF